MTKIEWNRVTWYSKFVALVLFVALPFLFFWWGAQYGRTTEYILMNTQAAHALPTSTASAAPGADYYRTPSEWQTDENSAGEFTLAYPLDFDAQDTITTKPSADWRLGANGTLGVRYFTLTVPRAFEPQTNFADATLTVGASANATAVKQCLVAEQGGEPGVTTSSVAIGGIPFESFISSDAGAGNLYRTVSYRGMHNGKCYAIEYTVHSSQIANYPPEYHLQPYNEQRIDSLMQTIIGTITFK